MEQRQTPHNWRTRPDPLEAIWPLALTMLRDAPELEAKALFAHLAEGRGEEIKPGLLRTFQRRVRAWRLAEGPEKEVFFTQDHQPGRTLAVDWTDMGGVGITIEGKVYAHKLFHAVLPYSNWEWAVRAYSESALSLRGGLKATLERLETLNIPVLGYRTDRFPGFYLADSGQPVPWTVDTPEDIAAIMRVRDGLGLTGGVVVAQPLPAHEELDRTLHDRTLTAGLQAATDQQVRGKDVTPFLLAWFHEQTEGASLTANVRLVLHNARLASQIATSFAADR